MTDAKKEPEVVIEAPPALDMTNVDDIDKPEEAPEEEPQTGLPDHLELQPCGLPKVLMENKELAQYQIDHGISFRERREIEYTPKERQLYELYSQAKRGKRATKDHFTAALRLFNAAHAIWPNKEKNLNDMKVM